MPYLRSGQAEGKSDLPLPTQPRLTTLSRKRKEYSQLVDQYFGRGLASDLERQDRDRSTGLPAGSTLCVYDSE
jgi:hypothetical protein